MRDLLEYMDSDPEERFGDAMALAGGDDAGIQGMGMDAADGHPLDLEPGDLCGSRPRSRAPFSCRRVRGHGGNCCAVRAGEL